MRNKTGSILDEIIERHLVALKRQIEQRRKELIKNNIEHLQLYELLGFPEQEGRKIDLYQNIGRFVYKYAGALLEEVTVALLKESKNGESIKIPNTISQNPKNFGIDCFVKSDNKAHEIKWRDATTDGDHIQKERNKVQCIVKSGMIPVRVMYYMPNRDQAKKIQIKVIATYREHGEAHIGKDAWDYIKGYTGFDLYTHLYRKSKMIISPALKLNWTITFPSPAVGKADGML